MRVIFVIKRSNHKYSTPLYWRVLQRCGLGELVSSYCVVLVGTSKGLVGPRVLERARCRCCAIEWSCGIVIVEILHSVEGGDVEQVCSNLETILPCLWLLISLSLVFIYLAYLYCSSLYAWYILCSIDIYAWVVFVFTLVFNQESHSVTSTLNLEESWGDSPEPFTGNSAYTLVLYFVCLA